MATDFNYANTITAGTPVAAAEVQDNFDDVLAWVKAYYQQALDTTAEIAATSLALDGSNAMAADLAMGSNKITGLADATLDTDAPNYNQLLTVPIGTSNINGYEGSGYDSSLTAPYLNIGNGSVTAHWWKGLGLAYLNMKITWGSTTSMGNWNNGVELPFAVYQGFTNHTSSFSATYADVSTGNQYEGVMLGGPLLGNEYGALYYTSSTTGLLTEISGSAPFSWNTGDYVAISGICMSSS